jgi:5,10-methenyltetrahydrofolate synthetase
VLRLNDIPSPEPHEYASPACSMHEVDPHYTGITPFSETDEARNIARWRKIERERLISRRLAMTAETRTRHSATIAATLHRLIGRPRGRIVSAYWPFRGEPDLRIWLEQISGRGGLTALPVVVAKHTPLVFRAWKHGEPLERGIWGIPAPSAGEVVLPDIVIAPLVGYDTEGYRLGYGGGFFDRTLAALPSPAYVIGVGYARTAIATIYPRPHDIPMNAIVTEQGVREFDRQGGSAPAEPDLAPAR